MTPAARLRDRAIELLGDGQRGWATDATSYPGRTLIAIAVPGAAAVLQVSEPVDPLELARMDGFEIAPPAQPSGPDIDELRRQHAKRR